MKMKNFSSYSFCVGVIFGGISGIFLSGMVTTGIIIGVIGYNIILYLKTR